MGVLLKCSGVCLMKGGRGFAYLYCHDDYSTDVGIASVRTTMESFYESSD